MERICEMAESVPLLAGLLKPNESRRELKQVRRTLCCADPRHLNIVLLLSHEINAVYSGPGWIERKEVRLRGTLFPLFWVSIVESGINRDYFRRSAAAVCSDESRRKVRIFWGVMSRFGSFLGVAL